MSVEGMNYDNLFIRMLNRIGDAMILSLLFVIGCIPIFTIGASVTATYYAAMKGVKGDDGYVFKNYIKSFKQNFKQSTIIWLIMAVVLFVFGVDLWFWLKQWQVARLAAAKPMIAVSVVLLAVAVFITMYVFPLQAKFDNKTSIQLRNAFLLSIKNFPTTLLLVVISAIVVWAFYYQTVIAVVGFALIGFGFCAYVYAYFMLVCFKPYLEPAPVEAVETEEDDEDWDEEDEEEADDESEGEDEPENSETDEESEETEETDEEVEDEQEASDESEETVED